MGLSVIALAGCIILLLQGARHFSPELASIRESFGLSDTHTSVDELAPEQKGIGLPLRIKIPRINVDAAIEQVALTPQKAMDVPKGPADAAWFSLGPRPGEKGSAVITGHFGWKDGIPAVFDNLYQLRKGDILYVEDDTGAVLSFVVRERRVYDREAEVKDIFGSVDGKAHLNLITCKGAWDKVQKSYSHRLVVFTDKE